MPVLASKKGQPRKDSVGGYDLHLDLNSAQMRSSNQERNRMKNRTPRARDMVNSGGTAMINSSDSATGRKS